MEEKQILILANFAATFGGNFIQSMKAIERRIHGGVTFVFPEAARGLDWTGELRRVLYTDWSVASLRQAFQTADAERPVALAHLHFVGNRVALATRLAWHGRVPVLFHLHNHVGASQGILAPLKRLVVAWAYRGTWKLGVSNGVTESMRSLSPEHAATLYNGLDFSRLEVVGETSAMEAPAGTIRCLTMGNHFERKGVDLSARAVKRLRESGHPALLFVAMNEGAVEAMLSFLKDRLQDDQVSEYVRPIPARNDIATYYRQTDVFLSPSREEGFTYATDEAIYTGAQVVLSRCSGQAEKTVPGFEWVADPKDGDISEPLAEKILLLARLPQEEKDRRVQEARAYLEEHFSLEAWAEKLLEVYGRILAGQ